jgi:GNAT superfamily N-acetyltransferase
MRTGPDLNEEHVLADGTPVVLRHVRASDAAELRRGFRALSPESRYRRFFQQMSDLSDRALHYLTEVDGTNHVAIVAVGYAPDLKTEIGYGLGRFVRVEGEPDVAEAAITVVDPMQRKGLGRLLAVTLAEAARERGIHHFRGEVLASNRPMRQMLEDLGAVVRAESGDSLSVDVSLDEPPAPPQGAPGEAVILRWLRIAADLFAGRFRSLILPFPDDRRGAQPGSEKST